jgi:hypothetical protein
MAQPNPEKKRKLDQVLKLVEELGPEEKAELRQQLDEPWAKRWDALTEKVQRQSKGLPPMTEEEIAEEVSNCREEKP